MDRTRALLLTDCLSSKRKLNRALYSAGFQVEHRPLREYVVKPEDRGYPLILVDHVEADPKIDAVLDQLAEHVSPRHLVLLPSEREDRIADYLERGLARHVVGRTGAPQDVDDGLDEAEMISTCQKIVSEDPFGLGAYIDETRIPVESEEMRHTDDRSRILSRLGDYTSALGCGIVLRESIATTADELMTNAIFNAPHDEGRPRHRGRSRTSSFPLAEDETAQVKFACDGRTLFLSVQDQFGALEPARLLGYLRPVLVHRRAQMRRQERGAGLGLVTVFSFSQRLIVNFEAGRRCEIIAAFDVRDRNSRSRPVVRSLNLFEIGTAK